MRRRLWLTLALLVGQLILAGSALAAHEEPTNSPLGWVFRWVNFALVFGGGAYLLWKHARAWFRNRADQLSSAIENASQALRGAQAHLRAAEKKLANLAREAAELGAAAQRQALAEAERIRALAREEAEKIEQAAEAEIVAAERAAMLELKLAAVRLTTERAEALLRQQINQETDAKLFRFFVDSLARSAN